MRSAASVGAVCAVKLHLSCWKTQAATFVDEFIASRDRYVQSAARAAQLWMCRGLCTRMNNGFGADMTRQTRNHGQTVSSNLVPTVSAQRATFHGRSILSLWVDTILGMGATVTVYNSLPCSTITPRSSITGAPGPGTN